jgi:glucose dehydrogenase
MASAAPICAGSAPVFVPGLYGQVVDLSEGGISLPCPGGEIHSPLTVECWVRLTGAVNSNAIVAGLGQDSNARWELRSSLGDGRFEVFFPGKGESCASSAPICDRRWHYLAMVLEDSRVRLYVDGEAASDASHGPLAGAAVDGAIGLGRGPGGCDGCVADLRISRGARDIRAVPDVPLAGDEMTVALWPLDGTATPVDLPGPSSLPEFEVIPAATRGELTPANGWPSPDSFSRWSRSQGGATSNRYVTFTQIDRGNVGKLAEAWTYHSGDGKANIQCNPIFVDGLLYVATAGRSLAAIDGESGREVWRYSPEKQGNGLEDVPARRGLLYWAGDASHHARIIFTMGTWIYALDPATGAPIGEFGGAGRAPLPHGGSSVPGLVFRNVLIFPGFEGGIFGYDIRTGERLWTFNTLPVGDEYGAATWSGDQREGANCWGGQALDESRGIAYVTTGGSPKPNFLGMLHPGDDLFSNCVIALDALTGRRLWYFQELRHDEWDLDIPAPPNLVTVEHDGMRVDAVAQVTKMGNTLLLDRVTGKPLFPFRLRRAPAFKLPGERGALYQPDPELPEPLVRQRFTLADVTNRTPEAHKAVMGMLAGATYGWYSAFEEGKPNVYFGLEGGAEWTGAAADPGGRLFVSVTELPWALTLTRAPSPGAPGTPLALEGEGIYKQNCMACHGANRGGNGFAPSLVGLNLRLKDADIIQMIHKGRNGMPPQPQVADSQLAALCAYLLDRGAKPPETSPRWTTLGYNKFFDPDGYPACTPPWGKLVCLNLNTGRIAWQVPLGEYPELTAKGIPKTGTQNIAGPTVTATGLVFVSGTRDSTIGAYDADTGAELWSHALPFQGTAPPTIYETHGREFVVLPATGNFRLGGENGDDWVAFALPEAGAATASSDF